MRTQESELLEHIILLNTMESNRKYDIASFRLNMAQERKVKQAFEVLQCEKLGTISSDFIEHPTVVAFINNQYDKSLKFWYFIQTNDLKAIKKKN